MSSKKAFVILSFVGFVSLCGLVIADICLHFLNNIDSLIIRLLELIFGCLTSASISLTVSFSNNIKQTVKSNSGTITNITYNHSPISDLGLMLPTCTPVQLKNELIKVGNDLEILKKENVENIVNLVYERIKESDSIHPIDLNFVLKYIDCASTISDKDIQKIWAELLVSKVIDGVTTSKRLLDTIKNLSSYEAKLFEKVAILCTPEGVLFENFKEDFSFEELSTLTEAGLIKPHDLLTDTFHLAPRTNKTVLVKSDSIVILGSNDSEKEKELSYSCSMLTTEGIILKKILKLKIDDSSMIKLALEMKKVASREGVKISAHSINFTTQNGLNYKLEDLIGNK
ncbi:MAG: DUF2806 domain-containing protein [Bacilli bacterium]|nr:DUF2806 domain-containing protein [Bacilli bacterium]